MFFVSLSLVSKIALQIANATINPEYLRLELLFYNRLSFLGLAVAIIVKLRSSCIAYPLE
jgi:hypothetical protein